MMAGVALCTPAMSGEDGPLQMIVERHIGVKTSIPVADIHKITFGQGAMHIDYQNSPQSGMPQEIALSEIKKMVVLSRGFVGMSFEIIAIEKKD